MNKRKKRIPEKPTMRAARESETMQKSMETATAVARKILSEAGLSPAQIAKCENGADLRLELPVCRRVQVDDGPTRQHGSEKPYLANDYLRSLHSMRRAVAKENLSEAYQAAFRAGIFAGAFLVGERLPNAHIAPIESARVKNEKNARDLDPKIEEIWKSIPEIDRNPAGVVFHLRAKFGIKRSARRMQDDLKRLDLGN